MRLAVSLLAVIGLYSKEMLYGQQTTKDSLPTRPLKEVVVTRTQSLELATAITEHKTIAGGTSIAVMKPQSQRLETLKEALRFEPGVMIQEFFGANDQPRLNIRGSGIQSNPQRRGVYLMQDGIPVNFADGSYIIGVMSPSTSEFVEIYKGANALQYGAATLGGLIDFHSRRGTKEGQLLSKGQFGSFGYHSATVMGGKKWKNLDAYATIVGSKQQGPREHNKNINLNLSANFGYKVSNTIDNRWYINYSFIDFEIPGPLTYDMLLRDPSQIIEGIKLPVYMGPNIKRDRPKREVQMLRIANQSKLLFNPSSEISIAAYYQYADDRFVFPIVLSTQHSINNDFGVKTIWKQRSDKHLLQVGALASFGRILRDGHINKNGLDSYLFSKDRLTAFNITLFAEEKYNLSDNTILVAGIQSAYHNRKSKDVFPDPELRPWYSHSSHKYRYFYSENISMIQDYYAVNPRLGIIYNLPKRQDLQWFANLSWSYEPPTFDELVGTEVTNNINTSPKKLFAVKLDKQQAITAEVGTRYSGKRFGWNISAYKSWLKDEILEVKDFVLGVKTTKNYPLTVHNGLEVALTAVPLQSIFSKTSTDKIILRGVYNYSDFHFSSGKYKGKQLAGIPKHFVAGALQYQNPDFLSMEINVEFQPSDTPIDHENTLMQPSYFLFGAKIAYQGVKNLSVFVEAKNLLNKRYASSYIINDQIHSPPIPFLNFSGKNMAFFIPGSPRAWYLGLSYQL